MPKNLNLPKALHAHFSVEPNPSTDTVIELAKHFNLTKQQVLKFFQNKRAAEKKINHTI